VRSDEDPRVRQFCDDARAYCRFIDSFSSGKPSDCYTSLLRLLSTLAKSGEALPWDMPERDDDREERMTHSDWQKVSRMIAEVVEADCDDLCEEHADDEGAIDRVFMLWDDLADLYLDLIEGIRLSDVGSNDAIAEAVWQWRFGYEQHWGEHLLRALRTVHEIRFRCLEK